MVMNDVLREEVTRLQAKWGASVVGEDATYVSILVPRVPLPPQKYVAAPTPGSTKGPGEPVDAVDVLLRVQHAYPHAAPDMFWVRPHLRLPSGGMPGAAEVLESFQGASWQRFSWHLAQPWRPIAHTLAETYMGFVLRRLNEGS